MSNKIDKNDPRRWVLITNNDEGQDSIVCFGNIGELGVSGIETGQPNLVGFDTEPELEKAVNEIADDSSYYMDLVELGSSKFLFPSSIYQYGLRLNI